MSKLRVFLSSILIASFFLNFSSAVVDAKPKARVAPPPAMTRATVNKKLKNTKKALEDTKQKISANKDNQKKQENLKKQLMSDIDKALKQVEELNKTEERLQKEIADTQKQLDSYEGEISQKNQIIDAHNAKINEIQTEINANKTIVGETLRRTYIYTMTNSSLEILLSAEKFEDLIKSDKYMKVYSEAEKKLIESFTNKINEIKKIKEQAEAEKTGIENIKSSISKTLESLKTKENEISAVSKDRNNYLNILQKNLKNSDSEMAKLKNRLGELSSKAEQLRNQTEQLHQYNNALEQESAASAALEAANRNKYKDQIAQLEKDAKNPAAKNKNANQTRKPPTNSKGWTWPVPAGGHVSSGYGPRGRKFHHGIDIGASIGTLVVATKSGIVTHKGATPYGRGYGGYGECILVNHGGGIETLYAHLSGYAKNLKVGQRVEQGQVIGYVGNTSGTNGRGSGFPHLHFEVRAGGKKVNPRSYV